MNLRRPVASAAFAVSLLAAAGCGSGSPSNPSGPSTGPGTGGAASATLYAAGDIGECGFGAPQTGKLLDTLTSGDILVLGDVAYPSGSAADFANCFDPFWGRHKARMHPVPGNHEYENAQHSANPYFDYFGDLAGDRGLGYYAFTAGPWRVVALNSEIPFGPGSGQLTWLRTELSTTRAQCTLVYWHRGLFSSGPDGNQADTRILWTTLIEFGADLVLNGHDHEYERFAPQDADGKPSNTGIREFIVGTGGAHLYTPVSVQPNSQVRASTYGIFVLTLSNNAYAWDFAAAGSSFRDTGSDACH
jgi:calcineurin-like phosphoesterase family protein